MHMLIFIVGLCFTTCDMRNRPVLADVQDPRAHVWALDARL